MLIKLNLNEQTKYKDELTILLSSFSNKRPFIGGATKATAYLSLTKDNKTSKISLSIHGIQGKAAKEDGLSESKRYDCVEWNEYTFQLKNFSYDNFIEVDLSR